MVFLEAISGDWIVCTRICLEVAGFGLPKHWRNEQDALMTLAIIKFG